MERKSEAAGVKLEKADILPLITAALKEDVGSRDLTTSALIPKGRNAQAELVIREEGVIAGLLVAEWVFNAVDPKIRFKPTVKDGEPVHPGKVAAYLEGPAQGILIGERTALNFLGHLSGIATFTSRFVEAIKPYRAKILATRKTAPGLRLLEKYAVCAGGGSAHRMGLFDQVLVKDNHLRFFSGRSIQEAVTQLARTLQKGVPIGVEVRTLAEFRQALSVHPQIILLDNMSIAEMAEAIRIRNAVARSQRSSRILLEASGGVTLDNVKATAATGVDRISIGALTHSAPALDVALEVVP